MDTRINSSSFWKAISTLMTTALKGQNRFQSQCTLMLSRAQSLIEVPQNDDDEDPDVNFSSCGSAERAMQNFRNTSVRQGHANFSCGAIQHDRRSFKSWKNCVVCTTTEHRCKCKLRTQKPIFCADLRDSTGASGAAFYFNRIRSPRKLNGRSIEKISSFEAVGYAGFRDPRIPL